MKISVADFNGRFVSVALQAENEAELYQLDAVRSRLQQTFAEWSNWDDMNGRFGVSIAVKKQESVKIHD
jgi:hypothetical protein